MNIAVPDLTVSIPYRLATNKHPATRQEICQSSVSIPYRLATNGLCSFNGLDIVFMFQFLIGWLQTEILTEFDPKAVNSFNSL